MADQSGYESLSEQYSRLAGRLVEADKLRASRVAVLLGGARLHGLDELLRHLDEVRRAFESDPILARVSMLIERATADFETAVEATLSGYFAVASDAMRDVMEIEMLLLDFSLDPPRMSRWLEATPRERLGEFAPRQIRARLRAGGVPPFVDRTADPDYRAHSAALHVSPYSHPIFRRGLLNRGDGDFLTNDGGFWEQYEHGRRLLIAIERVRDVVASTRWEDVRDLGDLHAFASGWERTQEMQTIYMALVKATHETGETEEDD